MNTSPLARLGFSVEDMEVAFAVLYPALRCRYVRGPVQQEKHVQGRFRKQPLCGVPATGDR
jgi:hypothetical protein